MPRIALEVAYDGTDFQGSQGQQRPGARTVDGTLKTGLESLLGQRPKLLWASRTDSGVHAEGNVCAFDAELPFPVERLLHVLNPVLPTDLRVVKLLKVAPYFHPRFDAVSRSYRYQVGAVSADPVRWRYWWELDQGLKLREMQLAGKLFVGEADFSGFAAGSYDDKAARCRVLEFSMLHDWVMSTPYSGEQQALADLEFRITANRFLRNMVCRMVGAVVALGQGKLSQSDIKLAFNEKKRIKSKPAPARGLTLVKVSYPDTLGYDSNAAPAGRRQEK